MRKISKKIAHTRTGPVVVNNTIKEEIDDDNDNDDIDEESSIGSNDSNDNSDDKNDIQSNDDDDDDDDDNNKGNDIEMANDDNSDDSSNTSSDQEINDIDVDTSAKKNLNTEDSNDNSVQEPITTDNSRNNNNSKSNNNNNNNNNNTSAVMLSKSWSIQSAHVPTYTGGKIGTFQLSSTDNNNDTNDSSKLVTYLITPVYGDLAIVNSQSGQRIGTIRRGIIMSSLSTSAVSSSSSYTNNTDNDKYDDDDNNFDNSYDADAITAFDISTTTTALLSNQITINVITCSRNMIIRHYIITSTSTSTSKDEEDSVPVVVKKEQQEDEEEDHDNEKKMNNKENDIKLIIRLHKTWGKCGHTLPVTDIQIYKSSSLTTSTIPTYCATGSVDGTVKIWDIRGGYTTHVYRPLGNTNNPTNSVRSSITCMKWFIPTSTGDSTTSKQSSSSSSLLLLAIGREDGSICIHNLYSNDLSTVIVLNDHVSALTCIEWNTITNTMISTGRDQVINVWSYCDQIINTSTINNSNKKNNINKSKQQQQQNNDNSSTTIVKIHIYTKVRTIPVYEQIEGMIVVKNYTNRTSESSSSSSFVVITAGTKGRIRVWKVLSNNNNNNNITNDTTNNNNITFQMISEQSLSESFGEKRGGYIHAQLLLSKSTSTSTPTTTILVADNEHNVSFISLSLLGNKDNTNNQLKTTTGSTDSSTALQTIRTIVGHNDEILDIKLIPSQQQLSQDQQQQQQQQQQKNQNQNSNQKVVVVTNSSQLKIFDLQSFSCTTVLDGNHHTATCLCVDVSPCGRFIVSCGKDKIACVWAYADTDNNNGNSSSTNDRTTALSRCVAIASGHTEAVGSVAFSRKANRYSTSGKAAQNGGGSFIVTVSMDRTIKRWNLPGSDELLSVSSSSSSSSSSNAKNSTTSTGTPMPLSVFVSSRAHEKDVNIVTIAPNDSIIATGSQDKTIKLWNASDLSLVTTLKGHKRGVWDCQFSTTDRVLATASGDKSIKLWSLHDYNCVRTFQGHVATVLRIRFISFGLQLVSAGADGLIKLWTIRTNECETTMDGHTEKIWAMDVTNNGKQIISGGADSQMIVWKDTTKDVIELKHAEYEETILLDQKLANHLRHKEYGEALDISINRDKPHHTLKIINAIIESATETSTLSKGQQRIAGIINVAILELSKYAHIWITSNDRLLRLLKYCREWNTKSRNCTAAMLTVKAITTTIPAQKIASTDGVPEILAGILVYSERHFDRLERLHENSYLLDFALNAMGVIDSTTIDEQDNQDEYDNWEAQAKYVLPPKQLDGRTDVPTSSRTSAFNNVTNQNDEVMIVGESDSDDDSNT